MVVGGCVVMLKWVVRVRVLGLGCGSDVGCG